MPLKQDDLLEACIARVAGGDKDALGILYNAAKSAVYGFALSIVQNASDAEDVLQDTFVSVWASAAGYKKMGKPMAWVLTVTRNLSLMKVRGRKKTADTSEEEWNRFKAEETTLPVAERLALSAALGKISQEESQIVMLHAVAGFKHREIADILELPLSTVLSKYNRAIKKLKAALKEEDGTHAKQRH